ncbi:hypothetical protein BJ546DRAFT_452086 [Cryomyces antarcticus]
MCIRIIEKYAVCGCVYYIHAVDACAAFGRHPVVDRIVLVGYLCPQHSSRTTLSPRPHITCVNSRLSQYGTPGKQYDELRALGGSIDPNRRSSNSNDQERDHSGLDSLALLRAVLF